VARLASKLSFETLSLRVACVRSRFGGIVLVAKIMDLGFPAQEINSRAYLLVRRHGLDTPVVVGKERLVGTERQWNTELLVYGIAGDSKEKVG
jgi:hypothetical protein